MKTVPREKAVWGPEECLHSTQNTVCSVRRMFHVSSPTPEIKGKRKWDRQDLGVTRSPLGDHAFEEEALGTNTALLWDRPSTSLNRSSDHLWNLGKRMFHLFPSCTHASLAYKEEKPVSRAGHLGECAFSLVASSFLRHSERPV